VNQDPSTSARSEPEFLLLIESLEIQINLFISCTARSRVKVYVLIVTARCRPVTVDDGRHAVLSGRGRDGRPWHRPVRPADIADGRDG